MRETITLDCRRVVSIKYCKSNSIESDQPIERRKPQIAVICLCYLPHAILRQAIVGREGIEPKLRERNTDKSAGEK